MLKYSLTTSKEGKTIIKIHHDFGDFQFYLIPHPKKDDSFSWVTSPRIKDTKAGDFIAREAAKSIATYAKSPTADMSFKEMVASLKNAEKLAR